MRWRVLIVDDSEDDALLIVEGLREGGIDASFCRVDRPEAMAAELASEPWDVVLSDYAMPHFSGRDALRVLRATGRDVPFILVSGAVGEATAVEMMRAGAHDYVMKWQMERLVPVVQRELREAASRQAGREAETALRRSEQRYREIVETAQEGVWMIDEDNRTTFVNRRMAEMLGYSVDEMLGRSVFDFIDADDRRNVDENVARRQQGIAEEHDSVLRRKDGAALWARLSTSPLRDGQGRYFGALAMVADVTLRRQAEKELERRQAQLAEAQRIAHVGSWERDLTSGALAWSDELYRIHGLDPHSGPMTDERAAEAIAEEDRARVHGIRARALATGQAIALEYQIVRGDGERRVLYGRVCAAYGESGNAERLIGTDQDVTETKAAADALRQSEERYRSLIDNARDAIFTIAADGTIASVNRMTETVTGSPAAALIGRPFCDLATSADASRIQRLIERLLHDEWVGPQQFELRGAPVTLEVTFARAGANGDVEILAIARDITAHRHALAEQERLTREIQRLLNSTTEGIYGVDTQGRCTFVNRAAAELTGYTPEELIGRDTHEALHSRREDGTSFAREDCPILAAAELGVRTGADEAVFWKRDGTSFPVSYSSSPISEDGRLTGAVVVFSDLSTRKRLEAQLQQADRLSGLGRLAATVAHEFNNVLMGIQPFAEILDRQSPDEKTTRATQHILRAVKRGRHITTEILRFTRPAPPAKETVDVARWLPDVVDQFRALLPAGVELVVEVEGEQLLVLADAQQLNQILTNLVLNARDAMPSGGQIFLFIERCVSAQVFPAGAPSTVDMYAHFRIRDTGSGMNAETLKQIFDPLFTTKRGGTGLGLAVVHQVVQTHGGSIFAESSVGKGTIFHIFLPLAEEAFVAPRDVAAWRTVPRVGLPRRVLLVEDEITVAAGVSALLEAEGISVAVADRGAVAIEMLERTDPDVVLLDLGLPDMSGVEVYEVIARLRPDVRVIFATGRAEQPEIEGYLSSPGIGLLVKPYDSETLLSALEAATVAEP